ncbi:MAG: Carboxyl-terminal protease [Candidatus Roizmanbacteria bacterium GW2011_GWC2_37_13]|uniref:Carboxyl-terminal protease n=1 Tax=Candidatus Roizmanbacteria bacterium GW2011_GWC2_37_13 TaxID=1618486 RepID=A0A0G0JES5_9BACT|nr:MAG: Carboxyl-terminal protease [Candidatus Roizmanbacteria bacterium GW2011_GWC2_37_13]
MKNFKIKLVNFIFVTAFIVIIFGGGYRLGQYQTLSKFSSQTTSNNKAVPVTDFSLFWNVWSILDEKFVDKKKLDSKKMFYGAIKGMVAALEDPYTFFLTPEENAQSKDDLSGKFEGIGAQLGLKDGRVVVIAPLKNSPAEKSGVRAGDFINEVDGQKTTGWTLPQAVSKIRGTKGTKVKLTLERNEKEFELTIVRDQIIVSSVELSFEKNLAILKLNQFGENTNSEWDKAVEEIKDRWSKKEIKGMVLDLRDNPGGYLESSVYLTSEFLSRGKLIVKQESTVNPYRDYLVERDGQLVDIPLSILINKGSASASEILAGSLRDHKRAKLIGEKSFGKGSVQEALDLKSGAGLHITIAKWILPKGDWINSKGIEPNIKVENEIKEGNTLIRETDKQLERAIEEVLK